MTAGSMHHRVIFEKRQAADDGYGNTISGPFVEQFEFSAEVQAKMGGEAVTAARLTGQQPWLLTVRSCEQTRQITTDWRARDARDGTIWNIRSIADPTDRRAYRELLCQSGVAT